MYSNNFIQDLIDLGTRNVKSGGSKGGKSTIEVRNLIRELEDMKLDKKSEKEVKNRSENWKEYFNLYIKSYDIFKKNENKFVESLDKFDKNFDTIICDFLKKGSGPLYKYVKELEKIFENTKNDIDKTEESLDKCDEYLSYMLDQFKKHLNENHGKYKFESKDFKGINKKEIIDELYDCKAKEFDKQKKKILEKLEVEKKKSKDTKIRIAKELGILTIPSINRNVFQANCNSPLVVLKELYNALMAIDGEFPKYKGKDLLKMKGKTFDKKVETSMKKVMNCKWSNLSDSKKMVEQFTFTPEKIEELGKNIASQADIKKKYFMNIKGKTSIEQVLEFSTDVKKSARGFKAKGENKSSDLLLLAAGYREQINVILLCAISLETLLKEISKQENETLAIYFVKEEIDKAKIFGVVLKVLQTILEIIPFVGGTLGTVCKKVEDIAKFVDENIKSTVDTLDSVISSFNDIKEAIKDKNK